MKWYSVKDKLPEFVATLYDDWEVSMYVYVYMANEKRNHRGEIAMYTNRGWYRQGGYPIDNEKVTHWCGIPDDMYEQPRVICTEKRV